MDRIIGFDAQMLIQMGIQFINTMVCFGIIYYFLYKPVKKFMAERTKKIEMQLTDAQNKLEQAQLLKKEYEEKIGQIESKQNEMLKVAHKQAISNKDLIIYQARQEAIKIKERAKLEIEYEKQQVKSDMKEQIINISWTIASNFLNENMDERMQKEIAQKAVLKMGEMKW